MVSYSRNLQYHKFMCLHIQLLGHSYGFISDEVDMFSDGEQNESRFCLRWGVWVKLVGNRAFWGIIFWKLEFGWERKIEDAKMWWKIVNQYRKVNVWPKKRKKMMRNNHREQTQKTTKSKPEGDLACSGRMCIFSSMW